MTPPGRCPLDEGIEGDDEAPSAPPLAVAPSPYATFSSSPGFPTVESPTVAFGDPRDHRWEGLLIGAAIGAVGAGVFANGFCNNSDTSASCFVPTLISALIGALVLGVTGGFTGGVIPKN
jgi:hypothetical protein